MYKLKQKTSPASAWPLQIFSKDYLHKPLLFQSNEDVSSNSSAKCHTSHMTCLWLPSSYAYRLLGYHASALTLNLFFLASQTYHRPPEHTGNNYPAAGNQQLCHSKPKNQTSPDQTAVASHSQRSNPNLPLQQGSWSMGDLSPPPSSPAPSHLILTVGPLPSTYPAHNHSSQPLQHL